MSAIEPRSRTFTGWHFLVIIVAFFAAIFGADAYFTVLAYRTMPGETAADPYEAGIVYQRVLDQKSREAVQGWTASIDMLPDGAVSVVILDKAQSPLSDLKVTGVLTRPATEVGRKVATFETLGQGRYRLAPAGEAGAWDVDVTAVDDKGGRLDVSRRLQWH